MISHHAPIKGSAAFATAGKAPRIEKVRTVALYDPDTGTVLSRNVVTTFEGAASLSDDDVTRRAIDRITAYNAEVEADQEQMKRLQASGRGLFPAQRLKAAISHDLKHAVSAFRIDLQTGAFVDIERGPQLDKDNAK